MIFSVFHLSQLAVAHFEKCSLVVINKL